VIERLIVPNLEAARSDDSHVPALLARQLAALEYAGAALTIHDSRAAVHLVETFDSPKLDPAIRRWASRPSSSKSGDKRIPPSAIGLLAVTVDLTAIHDIITRVVPERERGKLKNLETVLTGVFLGQDFVTRIVPALGPAVLAYIDAPADEPKPTSARGDDWLFPLVMLVELGDTPGPSEKPATDPHPGIAMAVENALRTVLALMTLDDKRAEGRLRLVDQTIAGVRVTGLDPAIPFAFAVDRGRSQLVLATSAAAVARYLESGARHDQPASIDRFRAAASAAFDTFLSIDLQAAGRALGQHRNRVIAHLSARNQRPPAEVSGDLDHLLQISRLFQSVFIGTRIEPDASAAHQTVSLFFSQPKK
jgi:hypothetical protein